MCGKSSEPTNGSWRRRRINEPMNPMNPMNPRAILAAVLKRATSNRFGVKIPLLSRVRAMPRGKRATRRVDEEADGAKEVAWLSAVSGVDERREREEARPGRRMERAERVEREKERSSSSERTSIFAGLDAASEGDAPLLANTLRNRERVACGRTHASLRFLTNDTRTPLERFQHAEPPNFP